MTWRKKHFLTFMKNDRGTLLFVCCTFEPKEQEVTYWCGWFPPDGSSAKDRHGRFGITDRNRETWRDQLLVKVVSAAYFLFRDFAGPTAPWVPFVHDISIDDFAEEKWKTMSPREREKQG